MKVISEKKAYLKPESEVAAKVKSGLSFMNSGEGIPEGTKSVTWDDNEDDGFDW